MATQRDFVDYVAEQLALGARLTQRKMFGEYALYCDGKVVALVCDNQLFIKPTEAGQAWRGTLSEGFPYPGARPWWLADALLDDREALARLIRVTADALPLPRPSKPARPRRQAG
mgnify:CR=1 FL=1